MLAAEVAQFLHNEGIGTFTDAGTSGNIFISTMPAKPDEAIMIMATGGPTADMKLSYDNPTIQVLVRGTQDPRIAAEVAQDIYDALHGIRSDTLITGGTFIVSCEGIQSAPTCIGKDEIERFEYSINFRFITKNTNSRRPE